MMFTTMSASFPNALAAVTFVSLCLLCPIHAGGLNAGGTYDNGNCDMVRAPSRPATSHKAAGNPVFMDLFATSGVRECQLYCCMIEECDAVLFDSHRHPGGTNCAMFSCKPRVTCANIHTKGGQTVLIKTTAPRNTGGVEGTKSKHSQSVANTVSATRATSKSASAAVTENASESGTTKPLPSKSTLKNDVADENIQVNPNKNNVIHFSSEVSADSTNDDKPVSLLNRLVRSAHKKRSKAEEDKEDDDEESERRREERTDEDEEGSDDEDEETQHEDENTEDDEEEESEGEDEEEVEGESNEGEEDANDNTQAESNPENIPLPSDLDSDNITYTYVTGNATKGNVTYTYISANATSENSTYTYLRANATDINDNETYTYVAADGKINNVTYTYVGANATKADNKTYTLVDANATVDNKNYTYVSSGSTSNNKTQSYVGGNFANSTVDKTEVNREELNMAADSSNGSAASDTIIEASQTATEGVFQISPTPVVSPSSSLSLASEDLQSTIFATAASASPSSIANSIAPSSVYMPQSMTATPSGGLLETSSLGAMASATVVLGEES